MTTRPQHNGHTEPSLFVTAFPIWLVAIPPVWFLISDFGYPVFWILGLLVWLGICFAVINSLECRDAGRMGGVA
jgi:hypothetical protein